ncbi:DUF6760 family protein [Kitasatospora sp. NPDC088346]|uniref:DUF6760 family protein n=1 Tax=Kitasatospora sp. NPDC088346 TaxID=3364073 RepID=UPI00380ECF7C
MTCAADQLYQEAAYIAYHFHWTRDEVLGLTHADRRRWVREIAHINTMINEG